MSTTILVRSNIASSIPEYRDILTEARIAEKKLKKYLNKSKPWAIDRVNLTGACAIASVALWEKLVNLLYVEDCVLYVGRKKNGRSCHAWIEIGCYVLDITAKQFIGRNILLEHSSEYSTSYLNDYTVETFYQKGSSLKEIKEYFEEVGWIPEQIPFKGRKIKLKL